MTLSETIAAGDRLVELSYLTAGSAELGSVHSLSVVKKVIKICYLVPSSILDGSLDAVFTKCIQHVRECGFRLQQDDDCPIWINPTAVISIRLIPEHIVWCSAAGCKQLINTKAPHPCPNYKTIKHVKTPDEEVYPVGCVFNPPEPERR